MIARQAQGMRVGEVIAKHAEDAYFMRVDNRIAQVPPVRNRQHDNEATSRSAADNGRNRTRGVTPTVLDHRPADLLMVATAPAAPAAIVILSLIVILVAEAATAGAPTMLLAGELGAEATTVVEATRTAMPPALHVAVSTPAKKSKSYDAKSPPRQRQRLFPRFLYTASQSTSPGEIQTTGDHQVRREARPSTVAQMLRPLH
jgi:hypothetical protein